MRATTFILMLGVLATTRATAETSCEPRSLSSWRTRCVTDRDAIRDALSSAQRASVFADVSSVADACRVLSAEGGGPARPARAELMAVLLNAGAGRLSSGCCVRMGDDASVSLQDVIRRADRELASGCSGEACTRIERSLRGINDRTRLAACPAGDADNGSDDDGPWGGSGHGGHDGTVTGDTHTGPGAQRGRGHVEHGRGRGLGHEKHHDHGDDDDDRGVDNDNGNDGARCCDPRTAEAWQRACDIRDSNRATIDATDSEIRRDFGVGACDALRSTDSRECTATRRQLVALRLNVRSGRLDSQCRLASGETVVTAARRAFSMRRDGDCDEAHDLVRGINSGSSLTRRTDCDGSADAHRDRLDDRDSVDSDPAGDDESKKSKGKSGKDKGKGKDGSGKP